MEMKSDSFLVIDNNGVPLDEGMFSVLLKTACDVIKNERIGCEFVVDGICRGKIIVEPAGPDLQDFHRLNVAFVVKATVNYFKGGQTTTKFFLPKEAKQAGIEFGDLCVMILEESALCRRKEVAGRA